MKTNQNLLENLSSVFVKGLHSGLRPCMAVSISLLFILFSQRAHSQLGIYEFTGPKACPTQNPSVTSQPSNAVFSNFSSVNTSCRAENDDICTHEDWNTTAAIDLNEYHQFTISANANYVLNLVSLGFSHYVKDEGTGNTAWILRSSVDNYSTNIATGSALVATQTPVVNLSIPAFSGLSSVTFRLYLINSRDAGNFWVVDNVALNGSVVPVPNDPPNPGSNSPQCANPGVTLTMTGSAPAGETWYWQTSPGGTSTANSSSSYVVTNSGTYYLRAQDNSNLAWSSGSGSVTVTVTPDVGIPAFTMGANSSRCDAAQSITYAASASNSSTIVYGLDAASLSAGNSINSSTGEVTYVAGWTSNSTITATAYGCNGPTIADHTVSVNPIVSSPVFVLGASSTRCQGAGTVTYTANAANTTGITYSLDAASLGGGNTINAATGAVSYVAGWSGTSVITANAAGCGGPVSSSHSVTITPSVGVPVFSAGASSVRCVGAATINYGATASNATGITYSLDGISLFWGNTINAATGDVTFTAVWVGNSTITARATGCNGPRTATHTVTVNGPVGTPVFLAGANSTRCQGAGVVTYTATALNSSGITYSLDAASLAAGNSINPATGAVTYSVGWLGSSIITASAAGCNGPATASHTATTNGPVTTPVFSLGATSVRCQGAGPVAYGATADYATGIIYSLNPSAITGGNTINSSTGVVTYAAGWTGVTIITATASGCGGPRSSTHTVTITPTVSNPAFLMGPNSSRCQGAGTVTYTANAANSTGMTYSLDGASLAAGNTIDNLTGEVTFIPGWSGSSTITATASGCNGPRSSNHNVTTTPTVGIPVFSIGAASTRCQGSGNVNYSATATNSSSITYALDAASLAAGNIINSGNGLVSYVSGWSGTSTITATAAGCNGPSSSTHTVTITPTVGTPVFVSGSNSTRCQGAEIVAYTASATNATGITYSLNPSAITGGNSINSSTGEVTYAPGWTGITIISASAGGCGGPRNATHTVSITPTVGMPVFLVGASSSRCQGAATITYTATATNTTGISYSLDAASLSAGNTINTSTGAVTYSAGWSGTTVITASAGGCNGPRTSNHTVTVNPTVGAPVFSLGTSSTRCQGPGSQSYFASAAGATSITYSMDAASLAAGNTINSSNGVAGYVGGWSGTTVITASAAGCNGPQTSTHTVTITPTVSLPTFSMGANSTRCQGAGSVTYAATASNTTGITYSLSASSIAAGNTINSTTGEVTYVAGWAGTSIITASAAGCNGPRTAAHTAVTNPTVGNIVFVAGPASSRIQSAGTTTYTANAVNTTGITYSLDAASLASGNTINSSTGAVTYMASWNGTSTITATAAGCNGPTSNVHTVTTNSSSVTKQLYLTEPGQALDRVDPVNTGDMTTANSTILSTAGTTSTTFTMAPALCDYLTIMAGTITVRTYVTISSGTMPANPNITAVLEYGGNNIITLTNPSYAGATNLITWSATLPADVTVPAGQAISLVITTAEPGVNFRIDYDSQTKPSRIDLPVSTFINVTNLDVYSAAYPGGSPVPSGIGGTTKYLRATVSDPFGASDITGLTFTITPPGTPLAGTSVATSGCTRTYEYVWNTPVASGTYGISALAAEGYENTVTNRRDISFDLCSTCPPVAIDDSATGTGGNPVVVDVLANDYDPNNNLNIGSLAITIQPSNGSAYISNNKIVYLPNGSYQGKDTLTYQVCDNTSPTPLCATAQVFLTIDPLVIDICGDASKTHTYYIPYPEDQSFIALQASASTGIPSNNIRTIISIKVPYPGMTVVWDEWEDGYEANPLNPVQATTKVWGDGNPFNGIAPGYPTDLIPAGGSIVLDNTMNANPRNPATIYYDGKDKVVSSGQIAMTQVSGEPTWMPVQCIKTNITSVYDFGQSFTIPLGQDFNSRDFRYTALFIRASQNNTTVSIDKDNNGTLETTTVLNEGESFLVNGGVLTGATVTSDKPVGIELNAGGVDQFSIRNAPIFPATWYSHVYYTPVPTSDNTGDNPKDTSVVMLYNSLNRSININWYSGAPASGTITVPAKSAVRFPLAYSLTAAYKFENPTGEAFTAIEIVDSYTPGGGGNDGQTYDWSFNLISEARLTDYATVAWAPGGLDLVAPPGPDVNGNPIWVTPTANTTIYVKYDGIISGTAGSLSPCGLRYDVSYNVNALNYIKIRDLTDNDQSGIALYTCDGAKIAAVYGEDPRGSGTGIGVAYWDVGSTIQPFCKQRIVIATDDYAATLVSQPVTISVLNNDIGFLCTIDPTSVSTAGLLQPKNGTVTINSDGTLLYIPNAGFSGLDTFEYRVCSNPTPIVCDIALVIVNISTCPSNGNQNIISGQVYIDTDKDGINDDGGAGLPGVKVYLYTDGNCNGNIDAFELTDSVTVDSSGFYQFAKIPEKVVADNFDNGAGGRSCANGSDGDAPWATDWLDAGDPSVGFCNTSSSATNTDAEIMQDGAFGYALRLKDNNVSARRSVNLNGATKAFLTFSFRRKSATLTAGEDVLVQASSNGVAYTTIYTISGTGVADAAYTTIYNQDISSYASANTTIRFLTNNNVDDADTVYIDDVSIRFLKYPQCYITGIATASVPAGYSLTTPGQRTTTFVGGGSCTSQFDFGFGKPNITVRGTLRLDANGLVDGNVNGAPIGSPDGYVMYAYLANLSGNVVLKTMVNSGTGVYSFPLAEINTSYNLVLSTNNVALGTPVPTNASLPANWVSVGEAYGLNNLAGSGIKPGQSNSSVSVRTGVSDVTNVDVGIQRLPNSDNHIRSINKPSVNQFITLNGQGMNPPILSGSDPEDCTSGCISTGRRVIIDTVPTNSEMYYNNVMVTNGQTITNFDPNLLQVKVTAAALGDTTIWFRYSFVDAATLKDPTPARYTLVWLIPLPASGLNASATINDASNIALIQWQTLSEQNTSHYLVERSFDNNNFKPIGSRIPAAGNSETKSDYSAKDDLAGHLNNEVVYYRVRLEDRDGKYYYSNVVAVRLTRKPGVTVWPNPFTSTVSVSVSTTKETTIEITLFDVNGRVIQSSSKTAPRGISRFVLDNLETLPGGAYLVEITDRSAGTTYQKLIKNK